MGIRLTGLSTPVIGAEWEYVDKDIIPEMFKSITGTYTDNNPDTYIFKYRSTYNTDIEFVGIDSNLMNGNLIYFVDGE